MWHLVKTIELLNRQVSQVFTWNKQYIRLCLYMHCDPLYVIKTSKYYWLSLKVNKYWIPYQLVGAARGTMRSSLLLALLMLVLVPATWGLCLLKVMCSTENPQRCTPPVCLQNHMIKAPSLRTSESCPPGRRWAGNRCRALWRWGESNHTVNLQWYIYFANKAYTRLLALLTCCNWSN